MRKEIRGNIVPALPSTSCHADFYIPWQPKPFLETDAYIVGESQNLANVLTVTKLDPLVLATTCKDYINEIWGDVGVELLSFFEYVRCLDDLRVESKLPPRMSLRPLVLE